MSSTLPLVPVTRPNGKVYRPRKPPRAMLLDDNGDPRCQPLVLVLGTHDVERGLALALRLATVDPNPQPPTWARLAMRNGERVYVEDPVHGAPCLYFEEV